MLTLRITLYTMAKIYIASSWRNAFYPDVVTKLREAGHDVYDFRNPPHGKGGFHWSDVDPNFQNWTVEQYVAGLKDPWSVSSNFVSADFRKMRTDSFQKSRTTRFRKIRVVR